MSTVSTTPVFDITYEQFCESWAEAVKSRCAPEAGRFDVAELRREVVSTLLADSIGNHVNENDIITFASGPETGIDAFLLDVVEDEDEGASSEARDTVFVARVLRFLSPKDLPPAGSAVLQETAKLCAFLQNPESGAEHAGPLVDFWRYPEPNSRLEIIFASIHPLPQSERDALEPAEARLFSIAPCEVKVREVSLQTIYSRDHVDYTVHIPLRVRVPDVENRAQLVIGAVALPDLYEFLKAYRAARGDLDPLYDKNVRVFLGRNGKVNKSISRTLREEPENFGLYNNGLTIVTRDIAPQGDGVFRLTDPSVVNGCQTTRTLWETLGEQLKGQTDADPQKRAAWQNWRERLESGRIVVKIVRVAPAESVGDEDDQLLKKITQFTNFQNAVKDKDFIALDKDFKRWKRELATRGVFLEILRNEGTAQTARQKKRDYNGPRYEAVAKAFELLKVYGAGWKNEPGAAWNKNSAFVPPRGSIFKDITNDDSFGGDDLLAALYLQQAADAKKFGKRGKDIPDGRRLTRFLFYRTAVELMRRLLRRHNLPDTPAACTHAILAVHNSQNEWRKFIDFAIEAIDDYMRLDGDYAAYREPIFNNDLNSFLKQEGLAKHQSSHPNLWTLWNVTDSLMRRDEVFFARAGLVLQVVNLTK